jgi:FkbM family methyltransferase
MSSERARLVRQQLGWTNRVRPMVVGAFIAGALAPERRTVIETASGSKCFADPLTNLGQSLLDEGCYEPETEHIIRQHLSNGDSFLDVGANEGYFSALAALIVGENGYVAAVEPQSRLSEIIHINLALNRVQANVFCGALGGPKGNTHELYLSPALNTGYSSLSNRPRFTRQSETVSFVDPEELLSGRDFFALAKVDVEGFEGEVIESLSPLIERGKISSLLLDYHETLLQARGVAPADIERKILDRGMSLDDKPSGYSGYRLYRKD